MTEIMIEIGMQCHPLPYLESGNSALEMNLGGGAQVLVVTVTASVHDPVLLDVPTFLAPAVQVHHHVVTVHLHLLVTDPYPLADLLPLLVEEEILRLTEDGFQFRPHPRGEEVLLVLHPVGIVALPLLRPGEEILALSPLADVVTLQCPPAGDMMIPVRLPVHLLVLVLVLVHPKIGTVDHQHPLVDGRDHGR